MHKDIRNTYFGVSQFIPRLGTLGDDGRAIDDDYIVCTLKSYYFNMKKKQTKKTNTATLASFLFYIQQQYSSVSITF